MLQKLATLRQTSSAGGFAPISDAAVQVATSRRPRTAQASTTRTHSKHSCIIQSVLKGRVAKDGAFFGINSWNYSMTSRVTVTSLSER